MRRMVGVVLMVDGLWATWSLLELAASLSYRDAATVLVVVARAGMGILAVIAGWLVTQRRPPGEPMAAIVAVLTAGVVAVGLWGRWLPTNLDPSFRTPVVTLYMIGAAGIVYWARRVNRSSPTV
jgi:hypothetical protein